jgi:tetratricopeptide (TPR) repeat protein
MMNHILSRLLVLCAVAALVTACGGGPQTMDNSYGGGDGMNMTGSAGTDAPKPKPPAVKKEAKTLFEAGVQVYKSGGAKPDYDRAQSLFEDAISEDSTFGAAYFNIGAMYEERGNLDEARTWYTRSSEKGKAFGDGLVNIGRLHLAAGRKDDAMSAFKRAIQVEPLNGEAHLNMAHDARDRRDFPRAVKHVRAALKENNANVKAYEVLALVYYDLGRFRDAGRFELAKLVCDAGLKKDPKSASLHNTRGLVLLAQNELTLALGSFEKAIAADPKFFPAHMNLGALTFNYRDYETSYRHFDLAAKIQPKDLEAQVSRAVAARGLEKFDEAEMGYKAVIAADPKNTVANYNLGILYQEYASKLDEARSQFETVLRIERDDGKIRKEATARLKAIQIQVQNQKMMEEMLRKQKEQEAKAKAQEKAPAKPADGR